MISPWKKIRHRVEWLGVFAMAGIIPLLPRKGILVLARVLGTLGYHLDKRGRTTALQNLEAVYGREKSEAERERIAKRSYQSFARTVCDQFWTTRLTRDNFDQYCKYDLDDAAAIEAVRNTGAIWVTPHYGNFEWIALCMGFQDYPFCIVAQEFKNPLITEFFWNNRQHSGHTVIPQRRAVIRLLKHLKNGGHAAFLSDLTVPPSKAATVINCMGLKTCVTAAHGELQRKARLPVVMGISIPQDDGTYVMKGFPPLHIDPEWSTSQIAQRCWDVFEPTIREHPEHWIWMYKHWRYHPYGQGDHYPPYSHEHPEFDRLVAESEAV